MIKYLIKKEGTFYKANLHAHSTISDGKYTPEELKEFYKNMGYSVLAYTDHDVLIPHNDLTDDKFLALNGYEMEFHDLVQAEKPYVRRSTHICLIALKKDNFNQVCYHRSKYLFGNSPKYRDLIKFDTSLPDFERTPTPSCINQVVKTGKENGFFVTYNHPTWSGEKYTDYIEYNGFNAMEIFNTDCYLIGLEEFNSKVYDEMLRSGKSLYCIATDDCHGPLDMGGGYTMIKAEKLDYESITNSLTNGNFYCSTGAEINELYIEDGYLVVKTAPAKMIALTSATMLSSVVRDTGDGPVSEARFLIRPEYQYVRITVTDINGKKAYTNAYNTNELLK